MAASDVQKAHVCLAPSEKRFYVTKGQGAVFPVYDGSVANAGSSHLDEHPGIHYLGPMTIATQSIEILGAHASSTRGEAFAVTGSAGREGVVLVAMRLPNLHQECLSCRTVHYFYRIVNE